jgi:Na+-transporting NADH:ubiquinone oxidoreductase subunit NqrB
MILSQTRKLKGLAALIWYIGGFILLLKGISLLEEAVLIRPDQYWHWVGIIVGIGIGMLKAVFIFKRSIHRNLDRIDNLVDPQLWQFYSPKFFFALVLMITAGVVLSRIAHGIYPMLVFVGGLDLSLSMALIGSSYQWL